MAKYTIKTNLMKTYSGTKHLDVKMLKENHMWQDFLVVK